MSEELVAFLEKEGVVDILCAIPPQGIGFGELVDSVRISRGTLHTRLNEGLYPNPDSDIPGLWGRHSGGREDGKNLYVLMPRGRKLRAAMRHHGMPKLLNEIVTKTEEFDRQETLVLDAIKEYGLDNLSEVYSDTED